MKRLLFLLLSAVSFVLAVAFVGLVSQILPSRAEFFAALLIAVLLGYLTVRYSKYRKWPVAALLLLLILFGYTGGMNAKRLIYAASGPKALEVSVSEATRHPRKALYSFTDARIDFERSGHYRPKHNGNRHYYALPVLGADWKAGDPVAIWTWVRTKRPCDTDCQKRSLPVALNYGLKVRSVAVKGNVRNAAEAAADVHDLSLPDKLIVLDWGTGMSLAPWWRRLRLALFLFLGILAGLVTVQWAAGGRPRNAHEKK